VTSTSNFQVLDGSVDADAAEWVQLWEAWPEREVFAHPAYLALFADEGATRCAVYRGDGFTVLYPFILRDVPGAAPAGAVPARDTTTPYGYGGAIVYGASNGSDASEFWKHYDEWAAEAGVVSEFVRFSLNADSLLDYPGSTSFKQDNIVRDLAISPDELWMDFEHKVRKNVKKAARSGVEVIVDEDGSQLDDFLAIYESTMDRRDAGTGYYFPRAFFEAIHRDLVGQFVYFHALHDGRIVSTELVLVSETALYSFLGGTLSDSFDLRPNDLLKHEVMLWGITRGKRHFVLGGGFQPDDGIFRYKKAFAPSGARPFSVGTRVVDPARYAELTMSLNPARPDDSEFFPAYRG
jgi:hypothetical protein